jgi:hypothetical protein
MVTSMPDRALEAVAVMAEPVGDVAPVLPAASAEVMTAQPQQIPGAGSLAVVHTAGPSPRVSNSGASTNSSNGTELLRTSSFMLLSVLDQQPVLPFSSSADGISPGGFPFLSAAALLAIASLIVAGLCMRLWPQRILLPAGVTAVVPVPPG